MVSLVQVSMLLVTTVPYLEGCSKMLGEDKTENKRKLVELLRTLADTLEAQWSEFTQSPQCLNRLRRDEQMINSTEKTPIYSKHFSFIIK